MRQLSRDLMRRLRMLQEDAGGTVAVIIALTFVVLAALTGLGIDYYRKLSFESRMDGAADAAALAAITTAKAYIVNHPNETGSTLADDAVAAGKAQAAKAFPANAGSAESEMAVTPQIDMAISGPFITATVSYSGAVPAYFGALVGVDTLNVSGGASSSLRVYAYADICLYLDTSQSMGLAATAAAQNALYAATPDNCVFGCHVSAVGTNHPSDESIAQARQIQLRIDVMRSAIQTMIQTAKGVSNGTVRFSLTTFDDSVANLMPITNDYDRLISAASAIDLGPTDSGGPPDTYSASAMASAAETVPPSGTGLSPSSPQTFLFVVTDGTSDVAGEWCNRYNHCMAAWDPAACQSVKDNHVTIAIIYTTYLPIYNVAGNPSSGLDDRYKTLVAPIAPLIAPNLAACASPGFFFQADDGPSLNTAVQALFVQIMQAARLTK